MKGRPRLNLVNQRFGKLTVISKYPETKGVKYPFWNCLCDCGRTVCRVTAPNLRKGVITSCKHCAPPPPVPKGKLPPCTAEGRELKLIPKFTPFGLPLKSKRRDLTGKTFGRWKVLGVSAHDSDKWVSQCLCGKMGLVSQASLERGLSRSCGCARNALYKMVKGTIVKTPENPLFERRDRNPVFLAWRRMKSKCYDPRHSSYHVYGGLGVRVHQAWKDNFEEFASHVGPRPEKGYTIQRIDNTLGFVPGNVRWAPGKQHPDNEVSNPIVTYQGNKTRLKELADHLGIPRGLLRYYTITNPHPLDQAIELCRNAAPVLSSATEPQNNWV